MISHLHHCVLATGGRSTSSCGATSFLQDIQTMVLAQFGIDVLRHYVGFSKRGRGDHPVTLGLCIYGHCE